MTRHSFRGTLARLSGRLWASIANSALFDADFKAIFYEDLLEDTESTLKKIEAFLEIEPFSYKEEKIKKRVNTSGYTHNMWSMFEEVLGPIAREEVRELSNYIRPHKSWRDYENYA